MRHDFTMSAKTNGAADGEKIFQPRMAAHNKTTESVYGESVQLLGLLSKVPSYSTLDQINVIAG